MQNQKENGSRNDETHYVENRFSDMFCVYG